MKLLAVSLVALLIPAVYGQLDVKCQRTEFGRECVFSSAVSNTALLENYLVVGLTNYVVSLHLDLSVAEEPLDLKPSSEARQKCIGTVLSEQPCENFIRLLSPIPSTITGESDLLICGTNAFSPKCWLYNTSDPTHVQKPLSSGVNVGYAPFTNDHSSVGLLLGSGQFFSAGYFSDSRTIFSIGMAPNPLHNDSSKSLLLRTPANPFWVLSSEIVSAYEMGERVYFFVREPAVEIGEGNSITYSRVIRVCKNDLGVQGETFFRTFQKLRLSCTNQGDLSSFPYDYNNLMATFLWRDDNGESVLYGAFSSATNGPKGAAICKFNTQEVSRSFDGGEYLVGETEPLSIAMESSFTCSNQRSENDAVKHQLLAETLRSSPLLVRDGMEFTAISVEVVRYGGRQYEVMFLGVKGGGLQQVILDQSTLYKNTLLTAHALDGARSSIERLEIRTDKEKEVRYLYATTSSSVFVMEFGQCSSHVNYSSCILSRDPFCAWRPSSAGGECVNKLLLSLPIPSNLAESYLTDYDGDDDNSPPPITPLATHPTAQPTTQGPHKGTGSDSGGSVSVATPSNIGELREEGEDALSPGITAGVALGALVVGIVLGAGIFALVYIFRNHFHTGEGGGRGEGGVEEAMTTVRTVNNDLHGVSNGKGSHLPTPPRKLSNNSTTAASEYDDVLMELPPPHLPQAPLPGSISTAPQRPNRRSRGRTESTKAMLSSESSEPESPQSM